MTGLEQNFCILVSFSVYKLDAQIFLIYFFLFNFVIEPGPHPQSLPYSSGALVVACPAHISRFDLSPTQPSSPHWGGNIAAEDP